MRLSGCTSRPKSCTRGTALLLALLLPLSGCYRTVPLEEGPQPGMRVLAGLTPLGTERMADRIGADMVRVEGEAAAIQPEHWDLRLIRVWDRGGREYPWAGQSVNFPREYVNRVQRRELDHRRSWLVAGAVTVAAVVLGRSFLKTFFGDDTGKDGTPPVQ